MARGMTNPMSLTAMAILIITTLVFVLLIVVENNSITATLNGDPEDAKRKDPMNKIQDEIVGLRGRETAAKEAIAVRVRELSRLDSELAKHRAYFVGAQQLAGTSGEPVTVDGKEYKLKESNWALTRDLVSQTVDRIEASATAREKAQPDLYRSIEEQIAARQEEQQKVLERVSQMDSQFKQDEERLITQKDDLEKAKKKAENEARGDYGRNATAIVQKEEQIRSLLELELRRVKELEPDGKVLEVAAEHQFVVVNIGKADRVFPGLKLDVFQYAEGTYLTKGALEVIEVEERVATCRIINEADSRSQPIAKSDLVGNPVFSSGTAKVFVLDGEFKQFNKEDLAAFITATGGVIRDKLSPGVDFLVAGDRSDKVQDAAREYQVQMMDEAQLLRYVQSTYTVK
ncbi:MAG: hypothetical protein H0W72_09845 [Planctomycetes bacterium]|nr:hypothetical protein [Planctomycetota bacterium]